MIFIIMILSRITKREGVEGDSGGCDVLHAKRRMLKRRVRSLVSNDGDGSSKVRI